METLAFIHASVEYEDPSPEPQLRSLEELGLTLPDSTWVGLAGGAMALSVLATAPNAQAVVRRGDTCPAVRDVQQALVRNGHDTGGVDGVYGSRTEFAVLRFQQRRGLPADGIVGSETASALGISGSAFQPGQTCSAAGGGGGGTNPGSGSAGGSGGTFRVSATTGLNVRSGPGTNYPVIGGLASGEVVQAGTVSGGYRALSRGGWVANQYLTATTSGGSGGGSPSTGGGTAPAAGTLRISTNGSALNVRSGPGSSFAVINSVANGSTVNTTGRTASGWLELSSGGWVSSQWVTRGGGTGGGTGGGGGGGQPSTGGGATTGGRVISTNGSALNVRSGPGSNFTVVNSLANGTRVNVSGRTASGWTELASGGWVSSQWVR